MLIFTNSKKTLVSEWSERFAFSENIEKMIVTEDLMAYAMSTVNPQGIAAVVNTGDAWTDTRKRDGPVFDHRRNLRSRKSRNNDPHGGRFCLFGRYSFE